MGSPSTRAEKVRSFLKDNGLQAWIAWRPDELVMMSGYVPYWGASFLLCLAESEPILYVPQLEPRDHLPQGARVKDYPWGDLKCTDPYSVLLAEMKADLAEIGIAREEVGFNPSSSRIALPMQTAEQIPIPENFSDQLAGLAARSEARFQSAFLQLYLRKTREEVQAIRLANRVANAGLLAFEDNVKPGMQEVEIACAVETAIHCQVGKNGVFHSRGWAMIQSGPNSADAGRFNRSTERRLESGDLVVIELATCVNGFWSDLTRTVAVGEPKSSVAPILKLVSEAQKAAIDAVGPGVSAGDIDAIARDMIATQGLAPFFTHHTGHHVGFRYHDPGFGIFPGEASKLEPGMIITIEPGVYVPERGGGARVEDNVLVTDTGYEVLSRMGGNR